MYRLQEWAAVQRVYIRCIETMTEEAEGRVAGSVYLRLGRMFLEGIGVSQNLKNALVCYQKAEAYLYDMVLSGDVMYRKSLEAAIAGQKKARENEEETKRKNKTGHSESDKGSHADTSPRCVSGQKEV